MESQRGNRSKKERVQAQAGPYKKTKTNPRNRMLLDNKKTLGRQRVKLTICARY